jgi:serine kinase of HPr protein (carbohydrate metabolism regulator)
VNAPVLHATTIALWRDGAWRGVLLRGPSGAGKSSLALRALQAGWRLVADDRTLVWTSGGRLYGRAPDTIRDLIEARGVGMVATGSLAWAELVLAVDLSSDEPERMPEPAHGEFAGLSLPLIALRPHASEATAKLALSVVEALGAR